VSFFFASREAEFRTRYPPFVPAFALRTLLLLDSSSQ
jgi:hypothetical protein